MRGVVPDELDADGAYRIARAYVDEFEPTRIAVGHDMRLTSEELSEAAIRGARDAGCDVDDIGLAGTEMLYFAVGEHGYEGGFTITASHNPARYNGMKMVRRGALPVGGESGLDQVRERALARRLPHPTRRGELDPARRARRASPQRCLSIDRPVGDRAAARRDRRGERHGRVHDRADPRAPARPAPSAATSSPTAASRTTSRTRCSPRTASSS